jgi:type IV pilus assembly protein PilA
MKGDWKMKNKKGFTLIELMIVVAIIGILAALAIPDFMKMMAKSKQSEARTNLSAIYTMQSSYFGTHNTFGNTFGLIGWSPSGQNLYAYYIADQTIDAHSQKGGTYDQCSATNVATNQLAFTVSACANIDSDDTADDWTIDDSKDFENVTDDVEVGG